MHNSKVKAKKNLAITAGAMSQREFKALIIEAEKGPFYSYDELVSELTSWKKSSSPQSKFKRL